MSDRGVSVVVNYVLALAITTLLITGLLYAAGGLIEDRRESAARAELTVVGERIASDLAMADRLAQNGASTVVVSTTNPDRVAGQQYTVSLDATTRQVVLEMSNPEVTVRVPFANRTAVATSSATSGDLQVVLSGAGGADEALEVRSA